MFSAFKDKGYTFNHIAELQIITFASKLDMSYNFYIKHKMCALEWKLNAMVNKDKSLNNKLDPNWKHLLNKNLKAIVFKQYKLFVFKLYKWRLIKIGLNF